MTLAPSLTRTSRAQRSRSGSERSTHSALWAGPPRIRKTAMWCRCPRTLAPYSPTPRSARAFGRFARWRRYESTPTSSSRTRSSSIWTRARLETNSTLRSSAGFSGLSAVLCTSLSGCASRAARRDVPTTCVTNPKRTQFSSSLVSEDTRFGVSSGALAQLNVLSQRRSAVRYDRARRGSRCRDCGSLRSVHARFDLWIERAAVGWWRWAAWTGAGLVLIAAVVRSTLRVAPPSGGERSARLAGALSGATLVTASVLVMAHRYNDPYSGALVWPHTLAIVAFIGFALVVVGVVSLTGDPNRRA